MFIFTNEQCNEMCKIMNHELVSYNCNDGIHTIKMIEDQDKEDYNWSIELIINTNDKVICIPTIDDWKIIYIPLKLTNYIQEILNNYK